MLTKNSNHLLKSESEHAIDYIVFKPSRAYVLKSNGDGFGSYIERLINVAHETHRSFSSMLNTLDELIHYMRVELDRTHREYQFSIIIGKDFDYDQNLANHYALVEHTGMKILIFSSIGTTYRLTTTTTNDIDDNQKSLSW